MGRRRCCCGADLACSPCNIPNKNLTLTWDFGVLDPNPTGTVTMTRLVNNWVTGCVGYRSFTLSCSSGALRLASTGFSNMACTVGGSSFIYTTSWNKITVSCSPLYMHYEPGYNPNGLYIIVTE